MCMLHVCVFVCRWTKKNLFSILAISPILYTLHDEEGICLVSSSNLSISACWEIVEAVSHFFTREAWIRKERKRRVKKEEW